ncbi:MAG: Ig-like domain-containing protein [Planctomycetaceae bacterium]
MGKDSFTFRLSDGVQFSDPQIVTIDVTNNNVLTTADYYTGNSGQVISAAAPGVLKNDLNLDNDALTVTVVATVEHGALVFHSNGSFVYTPATGFNGDDQFTYRISDGVSEAFGAVTLRTGRPATTAPQFNVRADRYAIDALKTLNVTVQNGLTSNDEFVRTGAAATVQLVSGPSHGTLSLSSNGAFTYTPTAGATPFSGQDSFIYRLTDSAGHTGTSTVTLTVGNHAPWTTDVLVNVHQGKTLNVDAAQIAAASGDAEGQTLTFTKLTSPAHGTVTFSATGEFTYTPNGSYYGLDSFAYRASDGLTNSASGTVTIVVGNERPTLISNTWRTNAGQTLTVSGGGIRAMGSDADGDVLNVSVAQTTQHGVLTMVAAGTFTYVPNAGYSGRDTFRAKVSDGAQDSSDVRL